MKKIAIVLMLMFLASCGITFKLNPAIGKNHKIVAPDKVTVYKGPTYKSEVVPVEGETDFVVEALECADGSAICTPFDTKFGFFKVRFASGKEGYINTMHFFNTPVDILSHEDIEWAKAVRPWEYKDVSFDKIWKAAIDTLDEHGYSIAYTAKEDGYIATDFKYDHLSQRHKVAMRMASQAGSVIVTISEHIENQHTHESDCVVKNYKKTNCRVERYWSRFDYVDWRLRSKLYKTIENKLRKAS